MVARIRVPEKLVVGIKSHHRAKKPLAQIIPVTNDDAFHRRKDGLKRWLSRRQFEKVFGTHELDNQPLAGFRLVSAGSGYDYHWSVSDPRGFAVNVSLDNLHEILRHTTIQNGEVLARCVWGREGPTTRLLVEDSPEYREAMIYTKMQTRRVALGELRPGFRVFLKNGLSGRYAGLLFPICYQPEQGFTFRTVRNHHVLIDEGGIHMAQSIQVAEILEREALPPEAVEPTVQAFLDKRLPRDGRVRQGGHYLTSMLHYLQQQAISIELVPTNAHEIDGSRVVGQSRLVIGEAAGHWWRSFDYYFAHALGTHPTIDGCEIELEPLTTQGRVKYIYNPGAPTRIFRAIHTTGLDLHTTRWYFVKATLSNPVTGYRMSVYLG